MADYSKALEIEQGLLVDGILASIPVGGIVLSGVANSGYIPMDGSYISLIDYPSLSELSDIIPGDFIDVYNVTTTPLNAVSSSNDIYVVVGNTGTIFTSADTKTWMQRTSGTTQNLYGVAYNQWGFFACGATGLILKSTDGITWSAITKVSNAELSGAYANSQAVLLVGKSGEIAVSINGTSFTSYKQGNTQYHHATYDGTNWIISGHAILTSPNLTTWTTRLTVNAYGICFANNLIVIVGDAGLIYTSANHGLNWTQRTSGVTVNLYGIAFIDGYFIASGDSGIILRSANGIDWVNIQYGTSNWQLHSHADDEEDEVIITRQDGSVGILHAPVTNYKYLPNMVSPIPSVASYYMRGK
jgi:photosystem II stability/assembly factor-like uncharacterized protein